MCILITGGCGYIGRHVVHHLSKNNKIIVCGTSSVKFDEQLFDKQSVSFIEHDFKSNDQLDDKLPDVMLDAVINNAYYGTSGEPLTQPTSDVIESLNGTVGLYYETIKSCMSRIIDGGSIINIGSMYGVSVPDFDMYANYKSVNPLGYGVGKAGVNHLTKYLANWLAARNITVNCINPGAMPSEQAQQDTELMRNIIDRTPLRRLGVPDDLLGLIDLLIGPMGSFITGQSITVDGGFTNRK